MLYKGELNNRRCIVLKLSDVDIFFNYSALGFWIYCEVLAIFCVSFVFFAPFFSSFGV